MNLYTLPSDVQYNADDLRQDVADALLARIHHDQPIHAHHSVLSSEQVVRTNY